jgi:hypothetical protein
MAMILFAHCSLFVILFVFFCGLLHLEQKEEEFAVYEPYCANYTNASELMLMEEQNLVVRLRLGLLSPRRPKPLISEG